MAFDFFAIFAIFIECEQAFSKTRIKVSACWSNLSQEIIEEKEILCSWINASVVKLITQVDI